MEFVSDRNRRYSAGDECPLISRVCNVAPAQQPLWAEATDKLAGEHFRLTQLLADSRHVLLVERKVSPEGDGSGMGIGRRESALDGAIEVESIGGEEKLASVLLFTVIQMIPGRPPAKHSLDAETVPNLECGGQRLRILRNRRLNHVLSDPVSGLDHKVWVSLFLRAGLRKYPHVELVLGGSFVSGETVVEMVKHFGFIQGQITVVRSDKNIARAGSRPLAVRQRSESSASRSPCGRGS